MRQCLKAAVTTRKLVRGVLPLLLFAALLPAVASAQAPGVVGYEGTGPATAGDTGRGGPPASSAGAVPSKGTLPFTGMQIGLMTAAGLGVIGLGFAVRRVSGPRLPGGA